VNLFDVPTHLQRIGTEEEFRIAGDTDDFRLLASTPARELVIVEFFGIQSRRLK